MKSIVGIALIVGALVCAAHASTVPNDLSPVEHQVPRIVCPEHGVPQITVPWDEPRSRFALMMERSLIDVLEAHSAMSSQALGS